MKVCDLTFNKIKSGEGRLILIGGRPSMGKTSFAFSIAKELDKKQVPRTQEY